MTLKPIWNWRSKTLTFFSFIFFVIFFLATCFLGLQAIRQLLNVIDTNSIAFMVIITAMIIALIVWFRGFLKLHNTEYTLHFKDGLMVWIERSSAGVKKHTISLTQISHIGFRGDNKVGFSLLIQCADREYRLGCLFTEDILNQVTELILEKRRGRTQYAKLNIRKI